MRFRMLGPLRVRTGAGWVPVTAGQQRVVLAVLLADAGRVVSTERLVDAVWGDRPPRRAVNTVQAYVLRLRRLLDPGALVTRDHGYELVVGRDDVDATGFERLVASGRRELAEGRPEAGAAQLAKALGLWQGPVFADVPASPSFALHAAHLEQVRLDAEEDHVAALLDLGQHAKVVEELHRLVEHTPLRERRWALLIRALSGCGRRAEALDAFHRARRVLRSELGLEPGPELRELQRAVLNGDAPRAPAAPVAARMPAAAPAQLPADVAGFTGRAGQLKQLDAVLPAGDDGDPPGTAVVISAIAGTAGVGKTALAVHWAHRARERFADGQLYVNLRGHHQTPPIRPVEALARFLRALGRSGAEVPLDADEASALYRSLLAGKRVLVVLDNAVDADQVRPLLPGSPGCLALVTSRDRLDGLVARDGAVPLTLDVLTDGEARDLLAHLLGARVLDEPEAAAELARLCGNLPLALRIAAANLAARPHHSIAEYAAHLAGDRLGGLELDGDGIRAAFDLSYAALPEQARRLFRLLGLVPGADVTIPAAATLTGRPPGEVARLLERLATAHLVDEHTPGRYTLHDLLRRYATERAAAEDSSSDRRAALDGLLDHYTQRVVAAARLLYPGMALLPRADGHPINAPNPFGEHAEAAAWLDAERHNLVAAVAHAAKHGPYSAAWQLADAMRGYLFLRMHIVDWSVVAHAGLAAAERERDARAQAAARISLGTLHWVQGHAQAAIRNLTLALDQARQARWVEGESAALGNLGNLHADLGQLTKAADQYTQALAIDQQAGRDEVRGISLTNLGLVHYDLGRLELAARCHEEALGAFRQHGPRSGEATARHNLGTAYHALGRLDHAAAILTRASALTREVGDRYLEAENMRARAAVDRDAGRLAEALHAAHTAVTAARQTGGRYEAESLAVKASIHCRLGDHHQAIDGYQQALDLARQIGNRYTEAEALIGLTADHHHAGQLDPAAGYAEQALTIARQGGYRMLEGNAIIAAATIHLTQGRPDQAGTCAGQALAIHAETGHRLGQAQAHLVAARAAHATGDHAEAGTRQSAAHALFAELGVDPEAQRTAILGGDPSIGRRPAAAPNGGAIVEPAP